MRGWVAIFALMAGPGWAEWRPLAGPEIVDALTGARLVHESATQAFYASGRTLYDAGRPSWGYWEVREDRYCSQWPPAGGWACYDLERDSGTGALRFVGDSGDITEGRVAE